MDLISMHIGRMIKTNYAKSIVVDIILSYRMQTNIGQMTRNMLLMIIYQTIRKRFKLVNGYIR